LGWFSAALAVCVVVVAALVTRPFGSTSHHNAHGSTPFTAQRAGHTPGIAARPLPAGWGLETAAQAAAVRHLADYGLPLFCGARSQPMVALTFDDGPGVYTHLAIRKLREYHVVATFFLVGKEIHAWPGWAQREKPYAVFGDHTMTHPFLPALPLTEMRGQISRAQSLIEQTVGEPVVMFRPPYEGRTSAIDHEARVLGMLEVLWSVDSQDSLGANYRGIEHNVIAGLRPGAIVLMHENRGQTIRALPTIFAALARRHLRAVTLPQLVAEDPPSLAQLRAGSRGCGVIRRTGNGS
jgi:peptidoglycan/xylan/chitin deacetylase (PgdA/CDA1 family)